MHSFSSSPLTSQQQWTVTILTPNDEKAYLKRLASGNMQVILTCKDAIRFSSRAAAEVMNQENLHGGGRVELIQSSADNGLPYTPYALINDINGETHYIHYSDNDGYCFKKGMRGACIFQEYQADTFLQTMFKTDPKVVKLELNTGPKLDVVKKNTQAETEAFIKRAKKQ